jgi:cytochrome c oxidase subunit 2
MHMHRLEKIWLSFGITMLTVFLAVLGIGAFAMGMAPPGSHGTHIVDPVTVSEEAPFDKPGLVQIAENEYNAYILSYAFGFSPENMEVPRGARIHFYITSKDVVHGFSIPRTTVNLMAVPGEINHMTYTFDKPGEYLVLCNEYCGLSHEQMATRIVVK